MLSPTKSMGLVPPMTPVGSPLLGYPTHSQQRKTLNNDDVTIYSSRREEPTSLDDNKVGVFVDGTDVNVNEKGHTESINREWEVPSISILHRLSSTIETPVDSNSAALPTTPSSRLKQQERIKQQSQQQHHHQSTAILNANRFTKAQRDRTLRHHKLVQPTPLQEKAHLSYLRSIASGEDEDSTSPSSYSNNSTIFNPHPLQHRSMIEYPRNASSSCLSLLTLPEEDLREGEEGEDVDEGEHEEGSTFLLLECDEDEEADELHTTITEQVEDSSLAGSAMERLEITFETHPRAFPSTVSNVSSTTKNIISMEKAFRRMSTQSSTTTTTTTGYSVASSDSSVLTSTTNATSSPEVSLSEEFSPTTSTFVPGGSRHDYSYGGIKYSSKLLKSRDHGPRISTSDASTIATVASTAASTVDSSNNSSRDSFHSSDVDVDGNVVVPPTPMVCQPCNEMEVHSSCHRFVVCADTQFGITAQNKNWDAEIDYATSAVDLINSMTPLPSFVCVCGDLVDMEYSFEKKKGAKSEFAWYFDERKTGIASREVCDSIQDEQNEDFKKIWSRLHPDIALVCLCGNHDVGNRPTPRSISRFRSAFGDEYLAFWVNGTYNIVLNNVLFVDPSGAKKMFQAQLRWLEERLQYAQDHQAKQVYVFAHHPWFLYDEDEDPESLTGASPYPEEWLTNNTSNGGDDGNTTSNNNASATFPDSYFSMPKRYRVQALDLFRKYNVDACFSGHFHQNLISRTSWGCDMIITAPLSVVFESSGKTQKEQYRKTSLQDNVLKFPPLVHQQDFPDNRRRRKMTFESEEAMMTNDGHSSMDDSASVGIYIGEDAPKKPFLQELNCRGVRVVEVQVNGTAMSSGFSHWFVPL